MIKTKINPEGSAKRLSAYSHGYSIDVGNAVFFYTTGQIALDPEGNVVAPNDIEKQTEYIYKSIDTILKAAGSSIDDTVKMTVYLTNMADYAKFSAVRNGYLKNSEPASTLVEVTKLVKEGCVIEIEAVAVKEK
jgi:2-iminobutanoate/2-iminopropanoate deaminase